MICPHCGRDTREHARFCEKCGHRLAYCPSCGKLLTMRQKFCAHDGTPLPEELVQDLPLPGKQFEPIRQQPNAVQFERNAEDGAWAEEVTAPLDNEWNRGEAFVPKEKKPVDMRFRIIMGILIAIIVAGLAAIGVMMWSGSQKADIQLPWSSSQDADITDTDDAEDALTTDETDTQDAAVDPEDSGAQASGNEQDTQNSGDTEAGLPTWPAYDEDVAQTEPDTQPQQENAADSAGKETDPDSEYILPESNSRYLTEADLAGFTAEQCRLARNELYARYGRRFDDETLQAYFDGKSWYRGTVDPEDFDPSVMNQYEVYNRDFIVEYEVKQGYREAPAES